MLGEGKILYYGEQEIDQKLERFTLGSFTFFLREAEILYLSYQGAELVRRIYFAVRGPDWETIPNSVQRTQIIKNLSGESLVIDLLARSVTEKVDCEWEAKIFAESRGVFQFSVAGRIRRDFLKNRIGICVLLPLTFAGKRVRCKKHEQFGGYIEEGRLPEEVVPHQPFLDFTVFAVELSADTWLNMFFEGDVFEMEDQRNWGDASFKIYSTPLRYPFPVMVKEGETFSQRVQVSLENLKHPGNLQSHQEKGDRPKIFVSASSFSHIPPIGLGMNDSLETVDDETWTTLALLKPSHLRVEWETTKMERIEKAIEVWNKAQIPLWISMNVSKPEELAQLFAYLPQGGISQITVVPNQSPWCTTLDLAIKAREEMAKRNIRCPLGGGTRGWFAEFHRNPPPFEALDFVFFAFSPQVHAVDNETMIENLSTLELLSHQAKKISNRPVAISPITMKMRFNPNASTEEGKTPDLPPDPRQWGLFGVVWTAGVLKYASLADTLTLYELLGPHGIIIPSNIRKELMQKTDLEFRILPLTQILQEFISKKDARMFKTQSTDELRINALFLQEQKELFAYIWSYSSQEQRIHIEGVTGDPYAGNVLSAETFSRMVLSPNETMAPWYNFSIAQDHLSLAVPPLSLVRLRWKAFALTNCRA